MKSVFFGSVCCASGFLTQHAVFYNVIAVVTADGHCFDIRIELTEIPRYENISASTVRTALAQGDMEAARELVPETTYETILRHFG